MGRRTELAIWAFVVAAALVTLAAVDWLAARPADFGGRTPWPFILLAAAMFLAQSLRISIATSGGRHVVVLTEVVLAVGLLNEQPDRLVIAALLGGAAALLLTRTTVLKYAVNVAQTALWLAIPTALFHLGLEAWDESLAVLSPRVLGLAFGATAVSFVGASLSIRIPIGLSSGNWLVGIAEREQLGRSAVLALGASALSVVGVLLVEQSPWLVFLLALPVLQILLALRATASAVEQRAALDFTVDAAQQLRLAEDVPLVLRQLLPDFRLAFGAHHVGLLLEVTGSAIRLTATEDGMQEELVGEGPLRSWLSTQSSGSPTTRRRDPLLDDLAAAHQVGELLVAPLAVRAATGAVVLAGRPRGPFRNDHVELARTFTAAATSALHRHLIAQELNEAESREAELERRVSRDALTSLHTRSAFERELAACLVAGTEVAVAYIDLNDFKEVNDQRGHAAGDLVLVEAARRMHAAVGEHGLAARVGGDEFALLLRTGDIDQATAVVRRLLASFDQPVEGLDGMDGIPAAVGVALSRRGEDVADLVSRADAAMYEAKRQGGERHAVQAATSGDGAN